jgi:hypothetical protein
MELCPFCYIVSQEVGRRSAIFTKLVPTLSKSGTPPCRIDEQEQIEMYCSALYFVAGITLRSTTPCTPDAAVERERLFQVYHKIVYHGFCIEKGLTEALYSSSLMLILE